MKKMRTWKKRIVSLVLVLAMMLGLVPQSAYASAENGTQTVEHTYESRGCTIIYKESSTWDNYVNADITIKNDGEELQANWRLSLVYDGSIDNIWNADILFAGDGKSVVGCKDYNSVIEKGQSVSFGFTAHGADKKPDAPAEIQLVKDTPPETGTEDEKGENTEDGGNDEGGTKVETAFSIPEKWKGLNYALFTSGDETLSLYTNETNITGDVHSNRGFYYQGTKLAVNGTVEAADTVEITTSSGADCQKVSARKEQAETVEMPDITGEVYHYCKEHGKVYDQTKSFDSNALVVEQPVVVEGDVSFNATYFLGKGIIYAKDSITYNVGSLTTPDDSRVLLASENGNITLNGSEINLDAVLYAPNGCVSVNANNFTLNGRIIAKQVRINGTLININAGPYDFDMLDFLFQPEIGLKVEGNRKENRKLVWDVEEIQNTEYIKKEDTVWKITKDGSEAESAYAFDKDASSAFHKEMIFRKAGTYEVSVTVTTGKVNYTVTKEIIIEKDLNPLAAFALGENYYSRDKKGQAEITVTDASASPDGDEIGQRIWTVYYDKNNNGKFEDSEAEVYSDGNKTELVISTDKVGKYKAVLTVVETFTDTIPKLIGDEVFLRGDTSAYNSSACVFEVGNEAPEARLSVEKSKSADIVFTLGDADKETASIYSAKAEALKKILEEKGVDARIDVASSKTLTAQDTFAWEEYSHYNDDGYENHILYEENSIKMVGYSRDGKKDFLYVPDDSKGQKVLEFNLTGNWDYWHSIEGGGFLFNTTVDKEKGSIRGFCILVSRGGLMLVQIDCDNLQKFRDGSYPWVQNAGKLLRTFPMKKLGDNHHFRLVADQKTVSVWVGDEIVIDNFVLPENNFGGGFGPIVSHAWHGCYYQAKFIFENITMQSSRGNSLSDIIAGYDWRPGASHYVINLSNTEVPELSNEETAADLAAALVQNEAAFIGIGNESNEGQITSLLNATGCGGIYTDIGTAGTTMDVVNNYLTDSILAKDYSVGKYLTTDDIISYGSYYSDAENDPVYEEQWEYEYDPAVFGDTAGKKEHIIRKEDSPITTFTETGAYVIRLKVRDNPAGDNDALDEYRKWSGTDEYKKLVIVQSRPVAKVDVKVTKSKKDSKTCTVKTTYSAGDADHPKDSRKGIRKESFAYKNVKDAEWTEGRMPNSVTAGETYLVKYQARDLEGTWSFPAVAVVKTRDFLEYEEIEDNTPPEIFVMVSKQEIQAGEEVLIESYAVYDYGIDDFTLSVNGKKILKNFGRVFHTPGKAGTITIKAEAVDIGGNRSEKEVTVRVVDDRDVTAPTAEITSPKSGSGLDFNVQIKGTAEDETAFGTYTLAYKKDSDSEYHVFKESDSPVHGDVLGTLDISGFTDGTCEILLTVEDAAGNVSTNGILLYIETGKTADWQLLAQITDIKYNEETKTVDIYGTVDAEGHLLRYSLACSSQETGESMDISEGEREVSGELLGRIPQDALSAGTWNLVLSASDREGNSVSACGAFTFAVTAGGEGTGPVLDSDLNAPEAEITGLELSEDRTAARIFGTVKDDKKLQGYILDYAGDGSDSFKELATGTEPVEEAELSSIPAEELEEGAYILRLQAWDAYGNSVTCTRSFTYRKGSINMGPAGENPEETAKKVFSLSLSHSTAGTGTEVQAMVTLPDNTGEESVEIRKGDDIIAEGSRKASFTSEEPGTVTITASAETADGETLTAEAECTFFDESDKNAPEAEITAPESGEILYAPLDITGTADDEEGLDSWKLEYRMADEKDYTLINGGKEPVRKGVLGKLDTTMLMNGQYVLRLTVQDRGGNRRRVERTCLVEGELKIGNMHIGFTDLTSVMGGTNISVNRTYDSRNREEGDFGTGWTLGLQGMRIYESADIWDGYQLVQTGSLFSRGYQLKETKSHDVTVAYGDGTSDRFELTFTPECSALVPITETALGYRCVTNPKVKLEILGEPVAMVTENGISFFAEAMYDDLSYRLTTEEGAQVYIHSEKGVYKITDTDGSAITVDRNGYHAKNGKSITFTRDEKDRITKAEDAAGNRVTYRYDDRNDLVSVTDTADRTVGFAYDRDHNLISITDPSGAAVARNEYDDEGRLVATTDADGNRMEYTHDVDGRTEAVRDRRGNTTVYTCDDRGNVLQTVDAYGNKTVNTYDENSSLLSTTDANGNTTGYTYDKNGNMTGMTAADGTTVKSTYTEENLVSSIRMMDKTVMAVKYDDRNRISSVEDANGNATQYSYTADGKLESLSDGIGVYQRITYDADGNPVSTTNGAGESASYTYDRNGRATSVTVSREENGKTLTFTSHYSYNAAGDITESIDNAGNVTKYEYDENGNQTASVDAKGRRITYAYDKNGNLAGTTYPDGTSENFTYDANGNCVTATDRSGLTATMKYDRLDRLT